MKIGSRLCGLMGFVSLLGFIGVFSSHRLFLAFFAFTPNFQYFFMKSDEMIDEYMSKAAATAFYLGMMTMAVVTLSAALADGRMANTALVTGMASGWVVSVAVHSVLLVYYRVKEGCGLGND